MKLQVFYTSQLKHALGRGNEQLEFPGPLTVAELLQRLSEIHGEPFSKLAWTNRSDQRTVLLVCVGSECVGNDLATLLNDGDEVTLLSPVSGG